MRDKLSKGLCSLLVAAAALSSLGCEDEPKKKPDIVVSAQPTKEVAPSGPLDKLSAPDAVLVYGGIDKATDMAGHLSELILGAPTQGAVQLESMVSTMALRFGLKDAKALDTTKPIRFAVVDPKANEQPFCIAVGIKSREDFAKSLPEKHKKDDAGNGFSYVTASMKPVFVNYIDDWAVFTGQKEVFGANKAFLVNLVGSTVKGDGGAIIDVGHMTKLYSTELTKALDDIKKAGAAQGNMPMSGGMDKMFEWMKSFANDLDKVVLTTMASKDSGRLQLDLIAKSGSELEKTFKSLEERKLDPMLSRLPTDAPAALVASFDPDKATELMRGITAWSMQLTMGQNAMEKDYSDALNAYWKGSTGEMALVAHKFEDKLRLSMLAGVRDREGVTKAMDTLRGMYKEEGFKKLYEQMGLEYAFKKGAYKVGDVSVDSVRAKFVEKKGKDGEGKVDLQKTMGPGAGLFTQMMSHDFAITDNSVVSVYGDDAKAVMEAWIDGKITGGLDKSAGMQRALKDAAPGTFFVLYGSPLAVAQAMQAEAGAPAMPVGNGIAISAGSTGNVVHVVLDVPGDQAKALMQMMGEMGGMGGL